MTFGWNGWRTGRRNPTAPDSTSMPEINKASTTLRPWPRAKWALANRQEMKPAKAKNKNRNELKHVAERVDPPENHSGGSCYFALSTQREQVLPPVNLLALPAQKSGNLAVPRMASVLSIRDVLAVAAMPAVDTAGSVGAFDAGQALLKGVHEVDGLRHLF